jgi:hypothetical protein
MTLVDQRRNLDMPLWMVMLKPHWHTNAAPRERCVDVGFNTFATGGNDLDSDTSLVHSQLRVRGDVSPGQYHSTVGVYSLVSYQ